MLAAMVSHDAGMRSCPPGQLGHDHPVVRLLIVVSGQMELTVGERRVDVGPGCGVFVDGETSFSYVTHGGISFVSAEFCAQESGFRHVLPERLVTLDAPSLIAAASAFATHAFASAGVARAAAAPASPRAKVLAHIAAHCTDTALNVATLAADLGLSARSLQRLFVGWERGVAEEIAAARLDHALMMLRDARLQDASLAEIAKWSGFGSATTMRRAVQAATGRNPREYRAQSQAAEGRGPQPTLERARCVELPEAV